MNWNEITYFIIKLHFPEYPVYILQQVKLHSTFSINIVAFNRFRQNFHSLVLYNPSTSYLSCIIIDVFFEYIYIEQAYSDISSSFSYLFIFLFIINMYKCHPDQCQRYRIIWKNISRIKNILKCKIYNKICNKCKKMIKYYIYLFHRVIMTMFINFTL